MPQATLVTTLVNPHNERTTFSYDAANREVGQVSANETRTSTVYDAAGQTLQVQQLDAGGNLIETWAYTYDAAGRRTHLREVGGVGGWDGLSVSEWSSLSVNGWASLPLTGDELARVTWTYDPTGQLLSEHRSGANDYQATYVYDPSGNRLVENLVDGRVTSTYDAANRLLKSVSLSGITTYSYDAAGNRRTVLAPSGEVTTSSWNGQNQLVRVELPTDDVVTYVWAPVNKLSEERIVSRDDGVEVQQLLWDNNNVLRDTDDLGSVQAEYTYQPQPFGDLVSEHRATESSFYRFDALGSTTSLTDASGNVTDEYRYTAFGTELESTGTSNTPYRWVGQLGYRQDDATGLSNLRARNYDPQTGRFVSQDPLGLDAGDSNFYRYVGNQPTSRRDPTGLDTQAQIIITSDNNVVIQNAENSRLDGFVGGISRGAPASQSVTVFRYVGNYPDGESYCVTYSRIVRAVRGDEVTSWYDWDAWFQRNGTLCNSFTGAPLNPPSIPAPPARSAQCQLPRAFEPLFGLEGLQFQVPTSHGGCQLSGYYNCEALLFPKDSRLASVAAMAETIASVYKDFVALIPGLGTLVEIVSAWKQKDVITGEDLSRLEQAIGLLSSAVPLLAHSEFADIVLEFLEQLKNAVRRMGGCSESIVRQLDDLIVRMGGGPGRNPNRRTPFREVFFPVRFEVQYNSIEDAIGETSFLGATILESRRTTQDSIRQMGFTEAFRVEDSCGRIWTVFYNPRTRKYSGAHLSSEQ